MSQLSEATLIKLLKASGYSKHPLSDEHIEEIAKATNHLPAGNLIQAHDGFKAAAKADAEDEAEGVSSVVRGTTLAQKF